MFCFYKYGFSTNIFPFSLASNFNNENLTSKLIKNWKGKAKTTSKQSHAISISCSNCPFIRI